MKSNKMKREIYAQMMKATIHVRPYIPHAVVDDNVVYEFRCKKKSHNNNLFLVLNVVIYCVKT